MIQMEVKSCVNCRSARLDLDSPFVFSTPQSFFVELCNFSVVQSPKRFVSEIRLSLIDMLFLVVFPFFKT